MPVLIGIGGAHSGSGKTLIGSAVMRAMGPGWGAIKCTPTELYSSVVSDPHILRQPGKDTSRYIEAGAEQALWVQGPREELAESLDIALGRLAGLSGVVVEGNAAIELLKPDIVIFIVGEPGRMKPGAPSVMEMADVVIYSEGPPEVPPAGALVFGLGDEDSYIAHIKGAVARMVHERHA